MPELDGCKTLRQFLIFAKSSECIAWSLVDVTRNKKINVSFVLLVSLLGALLSAQENHSPCISNMNERLDKELYFLYILAYQCFKYQNIKSIYLQSNQKMLESQFIFHGYSTALCYACAFKGQSLKRGQWFRTQNTTYSKKW